MNNYLPIILVLIALIANSAFGENIDPYNTDNQYSWSENAGWLNFEASGGDGVQVGSDRLAGYVWGENIGWISLSCENTESCASVDYGVVNDGAGNLSGFAWGENVGWINFNPVVSDEPTDYGVKIDGDGKFSGWAWGENIGWINFWIADYYAAVCKVTAEDLANFADDWLLTGAVSGNLDAVGYVDFVDYSIFSSYWREYCPEGWELK